MSLPRRPVSEVMQREVVTLRADDRLDLADDIMRLGRVRHMPVLEGERLVGILSNRDLLAASLTKALSFEPAHRRAFMRSVDVREVMSKEVVTASPDLPLADAARIMIERQIGCLPVVKDEGRLLGLLTETDLLRAAYLGDETTEEVMVGGSEKRREAVADWKERFEKEVEELRRMRDELRVRLHLGKADAKDLWDRLERRFADLETHARRAAQRTEAPMHELGDAARHLIEELRNGYRELRGRL
jgi:CBS domain-containing protein